MELNDDISTVGRVIAGDIHAFAALIDKHKDLVFTIAMRITQSREDAEEVAQDTFLKAYQKLATFRKDSRFTTWLYRIAYNESISRIRKKKPVMVNIEDELLTEAEDEVQQDELFGLSPGEQKLILEDAMLILSETDRVLLTLFYLDGMPVSEISEVTGLSESNVKVRLHRSRKRIGQELKVILEKRTMASI